MSELNLHRPAWIVLNLHTPAARNPNYHHSFGEARAEADAISQRFPGERFAVFSFTGCTRMAE